VPKEGLLLQNVSHDHFTDDQLRFLTDTYFELMELAADHDRSEDEVLVHRSALRNRQTG
jgi:hypothetical protein